MSRDKSTLPEGVEPGDVVCVDKKVRNPEAARVRALGKTALENGSPAKIALPVEQQRAMRKNNMRDNQRRLRPRMEPSEVVMPTGPRDEDRELMVLAEIRAGEEIALDEAAHAAPAPPPGYRYTMSGKLVPLYNSRVPLSEPRGQQIFLEVLEITGSVRAALDSIGMGSVQVLQNQLARDPEFEEMYDRAVDRHRDVLYAAAHQRAVHGVEVPIMGGQFKDKIVAYERKYSDPLMILMLKRHFPEFREASASKISIDNSQHKTVNLEGVDMSKLTRDQRDKLRAFLESVKPPEQPVIEATGEEKKP